MYDKVVAAIKNAGLEPNPRVTYVNKGAGISKKEKIDELMAVVGGILPCFKPLNQQDIEYIFKMCL